MATRRVTVGRVLVLLLVGVGIGVGIFLMKHLSPEELHRRVYEALDKHISAEFRFEEVRLDLNGVEVRGLEVYYPDKSIAVSARSVLVAISQLELLGGQTVIKQITLSGVRVNLRPNRNNVPDLPGILRAKEGAPKKEPMLFPIVVNTRSGQNRITLHARPFSHLTQNREAGAYVQDRWTINRLTLNGGLRYTYYTTYFPETVLGPGQFVPDRNVVFPKTDGVTWHDLGATGGTLLLKQS